MMQRTYITAPQLRARLGNISDTTLDRWLKDLRLSFPKPLVVQRRRLFDLAEVEKWEESRRQASA